MAGVMMVSSGCRGGESGGRRGRGEEEEDDEEQDNQLSLIALLLAALRRSVVACRVDRRKDVISAAVQKMEIGWPTDVRHVTHVTFDRFNGFLGLPVEFEVEIPCRVPSASASVFGVSPESMQCCYDSKGNSVPTILLLMQERLYAQDGLKAEGIFRINPENSQEEHVRDQLNKGIVPDDIEVHCLAGLIKAWFRELPEGVLDCLSPEQVLECNTEEECAELVKLLLPTQAALLNWAVDLMADVVEEEDVNKMNARNIAMVFAPNMTQMSDPLTALMHAVQVMNFLKTLILKTLREREEASTEGYSPFSRSPWSDEHSEDDMDSRRGVDMSGELGQRADYDHAEYSQDDVDDNHVSYCHSMVDEAESMEEIEECFLRHLELNEENGEVVEESIRGDDDALVVHAGDDEATQVSSSGPNATSGSSMSTSSTSNEEDWAGNFSTGDAVPNSESPSKQLENGLDEAVLKCQQKQNS
ncbi:hypothetical protein Taro_053158 [Colocasia esculenta]|uniref:Rho GTPase-activating protein 2 n=1 Tax=Colocasia esculenta TaxID=4460 RepID=A0A843XLR7_COLES|nr:hypothetical protein [Colocasia esculenta]